MSDRKKFFDLVSTDEKVKGELNDAVLRAAEEVAKNNGLDAAHLEELKELSEEELTSVAGGTRTHIVGGDTFGLDLL